LSAGIGNIVIAGAGQAGGRAAEALRARGFQGAITMLGDEPHPPYERPQLSKEMLHASDAGLVYIKHARDWDRLKVRLETGSAVTECDADRRMVSTADGRCFPYDRLLVATGTRPRRLAALEGSDLDVQYLRNVEDALRFRRSIRQKSRIVIIGGGVIGLEAACAAAKNGCSVTVIESESRLLARAFPAIVSDLVAARSATASRSRRTWSWSVSAWSRSQRLPTDWDCPAPAVSRSTPGAARMRRTCSAPATPRCNGAVVMAAPFASRPGPMRRTRRLPWQAT
jgi:NADH dehydrogenase FAD-containing subunit